MREWWGTKTAAWGFIIIGIGGGGVLTYLSPPIGIPVCLILISLGVWLLIRAYRHRDKLTTEVGKTQAYILTKTKSILTQLHKRNLKLKEKAVKQYLTLFNFKDFWELCNNLTTTMTEHKALFGKVKKDVGRKKLSKDMIKKRQQIDGLWGKLSPTREEELTLDKLLAWGHLWDKLPSIQNAKYKGITRLREKDRQWNKLFGELNNMKVEFADIFVDESLDKMISDYIDYSFGGSSFQLFADLFNKFVPVEIQPSEFIKSGAYDPRVAIENRMTKLLEDITNRIKELRADG